MAAAREVRLFRGDQLVTAVSFDGARLRIGRQPENDVVVEDLAVSRFHAEVFEDASGRLVYADLGSGNGSFVEGRPVEAPVPLVSGVWVALGRHRLAISGGDPASSALGVSGGQTSLFDFALEEDLAPGTGLSADTGFSFEEADSAVPVAEPPDPLVAPEGPALYAGLVVQRDGRFERVVAWDRDRLCVGRAEDCELVIDGPGISRRHALLVRTGGEFEVRDLDSINGTAVNGERVTRQRLGVGDLIRVGEFELTFLLDHHPIADEVKLEAPSDGLAASGEADLDMTCFSWVPGDVTVPGAGVPLADPMDGPLEAVAADVPEAMGEPVPPAAIPPPDPPIASLFGESEARADVEPEPEKVIPIQMGDSLDPLGHVTPPIDVVAVSRADVASARSDDGWTLEVRIATESLPEPLREALAQCDEDLLRVPLEILLRRSPSGPRDEG